MLFDRIVENHNHAYDVGYDHGRWGKEKNPSAADDAKSYEDGYARGVMKAEKKAAQAKYGSGWRAALGLPEKEPAEKPATTPERSPEEHKLHKLAKTLRGKPLKRMAAGGVVVKNFNASSVEDLQVLVAKTHPKWGSYWVLPKGGADPDEHIHDTASREVEEETGVKARVLPEHPPYVRSSTFGVAGKYDLPLVTKALKDAHPEEADFIEKHKELLKHEHFTIENNSHYFIMQHTGGEPITSPDQSHDQEMSEARFMPVREALKIPKVGDIVKELLPALKKQLERPREKAEAEGIDEGLYADLTAAYGFPQ
jgi:8-oxo-dGTP pyrophosphatase MutT (NUDIX family)